MEICITGKVCIVVRKFDRAFYAFAEHEPERLYKGRTSFCAVGQVVVRNQDLIKKHGLGTVRLLHETGREATLFPLAACEFNTQSFRAEYPLPKRKAG